VSDKLDDAAKNAAKDPQDPGNQRDLQDAVDEANAFIDATEGLLPSAPVQTTLGDLAKLTNNDDPEDLGATTDRPRDRPPVKEKPKKEAKLLNDLLQPAHPKSKDLAEALDRAGFLFFFLFFFFFFFLPFYASVTVNGNTTHNRQGTC